MSDKKQMPISLVSRDLGIVETIIKKGKTYFAVYKDGKIEIKSSIEIKGEKVSPMSEESGIIKNSLLGLPPEPIEYSSEQELYQEITQIIRSYFYCREDFIKISALYIMMSWLYDSFNEIPYLRVLGGFSTGKSRFLDVVGGCCYKRLNFNGSSSISSIFRALDQFKGTLTFDEGDFKSSDFASEATKIFNLGYSKNMSVTRSGERGGSNKYFELESYSVFGPKIISSRQGYKDLALESRCITQELQVIKKRMNIPIQLPPEFDSQIRTIRGKLLMFRFLNLKNFNIEEFDVPDINNMRILQVMTPIWAIAKLLSKTEEDLVIKFAKSMAKEISRAQLITDEASVLVAIIKLIEKNKIYMKDISREVSHISGIIKDDDIDNYSYHSDFMSARKVGFLIETRLHLKKNRDNRGLYLLVNKAFKNHIAGLRDRFGITEDLVY